MIARTLSATFFILFAYAGAPEAAFALPSDRSIFYNLREDPEDPESDVVFRIELILHAMSATGSTVKWRIDEAVFTQYDGQTVLGEFSKVLPTVPGSDGLWWVTHANTEAPTLDEFDMPPHLTGTAERKSGSGADLAFDFEGVAYTPPPGGPPFDPTAGIDHSMKNASTQEIIVQAEEEPTEME
ncbi:MAG: hypothetical protein DCC65_16250 [Planctomycetota bacterium]|nr:MAG: hypothetical protein DCC65_16250 [Planctomycetota bacterium]